MSVVVACQPATVELTDYPKGEIAVEVELLNTQFWEAWRAAGVDRGMSYYADSPALIAAIDGGSSTGLLWLTLNGYVNFTPTSKGATEKVEVGGKHRTGIESHRKPRAFVVQGMAGVRKCLNHHSHTP